MVNNINYREELDKARKVIDGVECDGRQEVLDAYWDVCCGLVLVAEENIKEQNREWENASLAKELLNIAAYMEGYDQMLDNIYAAISRMINTIFDHPRLKADMLELELLILQRIEAQHDEDLNLSEDIQNELSFYRRNINRADNGDFNNIEQKGHLKSDPVEWSAEYESVIDEANKIIYSLLEDFPRGMGFCFAYWHKKEQVLREIYGIKWRSPSIMNPQVIFD